MLADSEISKQYEVLSVLGQGGMSIIYKARHRQMDRLVAIKILQPQLAASEQHLKRFTREAEVLSRFDHPNIVKVWSYGIIEGTKPYLVMEFIDGQTLASLLKEKGPLAIERFITVFELVLKGLAHAHEQGIVHRDLKPSNLMIAGSNSEIVKIVDFGIARILEEDQKLTKTGAVLGTPAYMSPEQCSNHKLDERSDIYSISCAMYESLSGAPPFSDENALGLMMKHLQENPSPLAICAETAAGRSIDRMVRTGLNKEPSQRYQNAAEMLDELNRIASGQEAVGVPRSAGVKAARVTGGRRALSAGLLAVGTVLACLFLFSLKAPKSVSPVDKETSATDEDPPTATWQYQFETGRRWVGRDDKKAVRHLERAVEMAKAQKLESWRLRASEYQLSLALHHLGEEERSMALLKQIYSDGRDKTKYDESYAGALLQFGARHLEANEPTEAMKWYGDLLAYEESFSGHDEGNVRNSAWAALDVGDCLRDLHRYDEALPMYKKAVIYCDRWDEPLASELSTNVYRQLGDCYVRLGDDRNAAAAYSKITRFHPHEGSVEAHNCDYARKCLEIVEGRLGKTANK
jgi:serine/threonine protein kinase